MVNQPEGKLFNLKFTITKTLPLSMKNTYDSVFSEKVG